MPNIDEILRRNPQAAQGYAEVRKALEDIRQLREAGLAPGPALAVPPGGKTSMNDLKALQLHRHFNFARA